MIAYENALYEGQHFCVYDLKDEAGEYIESERIRMRKASQGGKLICPECNEKLELCAGNKVEPYLRHHDASRCLSGMGDPHGISDRKARRLMHDIAKRSFQDMSIEFNKRIVPGCIADIFIHDSNSKRIALKFINRERKYEDWENVHRKFREEGIVDIWFLNTKHINHKFNTFEDLLSTEFNQIFYLDYVEDKFLIREKCKLPADNREKIIVEKKYSISDVKIDFEGHFIGDFVEYRNKEVDRVNQAKIQQIAKEQEYRAKERENLAKKREYDEKRALDRQKEQETEEKKRTIVASDRILEVIDQQEKVVIDESGTRWIKCTICNEVKPVDEFLSYGGLGTINLGKCEECRGRRH